MSWVDLLENPIPIKNIYNDYEPKLQKIRILSIVLSEDGPNCALRFNLNCKPLIIPDKWKKQQFNTIQITLSLFGLTSLVIDGWSCNNMANIDIAKENRKILFQVNGYEFRFSCISQCMIVDNISAYTCNLDL